MKKNPFILAAYLRERIVPVSVYIVEALIFMMIAALYGYERVFVNMTYALGLVFFFGGCYLVWDCLRYRQKYRELQQLLSAGERADDLPQAVSAMEQAYQQIIAAQEAEKRALITQLDEKQQNMADYYTMWTHQIKVPLSAMDLLLQNADGIGNIRTVRQLREEVFKTGQYVDMALHYARMESISSDLSFTRLDVEELVKKALKKILASFQRSGDRSAFGRMPCAGGHGRQVAVLRD